MSWWASFGGLAVIPITVMLNWSQRFLWLTDTVCVSACTARCVRCEWHRHEQQKAGVLIIHHLKSYSDISLLIFLLSWCQNSVRLIINRYTRRVAPWPYVHMPEWGAATLLPSSDLTSEGERKRLNEVKHSSNKSPSVFFWSERRQLKLVFMRIDLSEVEKLICSFYSYWNLIPFLCKGCLIL